MKIKNQKSKIKNTNQKLKNFNFTNSIWILIFGFCILSLGCDAFVRKFTRKPKKENLPQEQMVLVPQEYLGHQITKEELYRQYFLYWKSWMGELIESLSPQANHKKQIDCANEAINNLEQLGLLLNIDMQKKLDIYIEQLRALKDLIIKDAYGNNITRNRLTAEQIKRNILRYFSYQRIKDYLV